MNPGPQIMFTEINLWCVNNLSELTKIKGEMKGRGKLTPEERQKIRLPRSSC